MNGYLLDTNVLSETFKREPNARVMAFIDALPNDVVFTSSIVISELRRGAERKMLTDLVYGRKLSVWIDGLEINMKGQVLPVDGGVAAIWGKLQTPRDRPIMDMLIAATAMVHELTLVTRNTRDFVDLDLALLNPWM